MKVRIDKSFEKDVSKIKNRKLLLKVARIIEDLQIADHLTDIPQLKKIKGYTQYYRIGIEFQEDTIYFLRFLHRKDVYKFFP